MINTQHRMWSAKPAAFRVGLFCLTAGLSLSDAGVTTASAPVQVHLQSCMVASGVLCESWGMTYRAFVSS